MIKYHDNNIFPEYGEDHRLLDNWDANKNYKDNEYCHVHFRLDTPSYRKNGNIGFDNEEEAVTFYKAIFEVMSKLGWSYANKKYKYRDGLTDLKKDKCELYIHPDDLSGDVKKNEVKIIAEALENNKLFTIRWVDIYNDCFDITKDEQIANLEKHKDEIRKMLFERCKTSRRNKYHYANEIYPKIGSKFELDVVGKHFRSYYCYGETLEYVSQVANEMAEEGYLNKFSDGRNLYIRTCNKTELKAKKLKEIF